MTADTIDLLLTALRQTLRNEPERDFTTAELAKTSGVPASLLVAMGPHLPEAHRGAERPGLGRFKDRQVKPWIWRHVDTR